MPTLLIVIGSTRPVRAGVPIARWFEDVARKHGAFDVEVADLKTLDLPLLDESQHPRLAQYEHAHTKAWSQTVSRADAVVFILPEYNYSMTAPVKNAIDYLYAEWNYKPLGLVSYGGISGGLRAAQMVKQAVTTVKMMPIPEGVSVHYAAKYIKDGVFQPDDSTEPLARAMLDELARWEDALRPLRGAQRQTLS